MMTQKSYRRVQKSANYLKRRFSQPIKTAVILGSGWTAFTDAVTVLDRIPYHKIPGFPHPTVKYQKGELLLAEYQGMPILIFRGRYHFYEGFEMWETAYPVFVCHLMGIEEIILTNAAGGVNLHYHVGDLVCVTDHIKLTTQSPCRGMAIPQFGERFFEVQSVYDPTLLQIAATCAQQLQIPLKTGVYAYVAGPQYETEAEIKMLRNCGADLVGMSTVAEVIAAAQCGRKVLCISMVANLAAGMVKEAPSHEEVMQTGDASIDRCTALLCAVLAEIHARSKES